MHGSGLNRKHEPIPAFMKPLSGKLAIALENDSKTQQIVEMRPPNQSGKPVNPVVGYPEGNQFAKFVKSSRQEIG